MLKSSHLFRVVALSMVVFLIGCSAPQSPTPSAGTPTAVPATATPVATPGAKAEKPSVALNVLATGTFLADIAQRVAGDRLKVEVLLPVGADPHTFHASPSDVAKVTWSNVLIVNGAGAEAFLDDVLANAGGERLVIEASAGLVSRKADRDNHRKDSHHDDEDEKHRDDSNRHDGDEHRERHENDSHHHHHEGDPHFWLDPIHVITYVENIRDGLSKADPDGAAVYEVNAETYIGELRELDSWIAAQVQQVPPEHRLLVTNHESLGYFADRYGFIVVGTILQSISSGASPSAQQMVDLIEQIRSTGVKAVFLETGTNPQLAEQVAKEAGIKVADELYTHSLSGPDGPAPTYVDMMRYNVKVIVDALK